MLGRGVGQTCDIELGDFWRRRGLDAVGLVRIERLGELPKGRKPNLGFAEVSGDPEF